MLCRISVLHLRLALHYCASAPIQKFNYRRVATGTDWVPEHRRFAFGLEPR